MNFFVTKERKLWTNCDKLPSSEFWKISSSWKKRLIFWPTNVIKNKKYLKKLKIRIWYFWSYRAFVVVINHHFQGKVFKRWEVSEQIRLWCLTDTAKSLSQSFLVDTSDVIFDVQWRCSKVWKSPNV